MFRGVKCHKEKKKMYIFDIVAAMLSPIGIAVRVMLLMSKISDIFFAKYGLQSLCKIICKIALLRQT